MRLFLILMLLFMTATQAKKTQPLDHLGIAALLIRDGHYDRALESLKLVDLADEKTNMTRYYTLHALAHMKKEVYKTALESFDAALALEQADPVLHIYKAQCFYALADFKQVLASFEAAGAVATTQPQYFAMQADALFKLARHNEAFEILNSGIEAFSEFTGLYKQKFFYATELGLFQSALDLARAFIAHDSDAAKAYMIAASALHKAKGTNEAVLLLQEGKLHYPKNADIAVLLAHLYIAKGHIQAAADLFDGASIIDSSYIKEASELYRRAKKLYRSLYFNAQILDQTEKYKQRLAILLEFGDYEQASAMEAALTRVDLIKDEEIRYALAFSLFQTAAYNRSEKHLAQLTRSDLFAKAVELRKSIELCKTAPWECY